MKAEKVIDWLETKSKRNHPDSIRTMLETMAHFVDIAQKFEFSSIPYEITDVKEEGTNEYTNEYWIKPPSLERKEKIWFEKNLIPFPYEVVWYEFPYPESRNKMTNVNVLVICLGDGLYHTNAFFHYANGAITFSPFIYKYLFENGELKYSRSEYNVMQNVPQDEQEQLCAVTLEISKLVFYLTLMINSRSSTIEKIEPPVKVNNKRALKGKRLIDRHTRVVIVPKHIISSSKRDSDDNTVCRGLYLCRSHMRHYDHETPNSKWAHDIEHEGKKGWWVMIIPQHFRGSRELGEITHDYVVH